MLKTNYTKVSKVYDKNSTRKTFAKDEDIGTLLAENGKITVLDLGCGTGNWLDCQQQYYEDDSITWIGLDASAAMLQKAKEKNLHTEFQVKKAEELDFKECIGLLVCNFAFHHFEDKNRALERIHAALSANGMFKYRNIEPESMKDWWVYHFCPEAYYEDMHRFWPKDLLSYELQKHGFCSVTIKREYYESSKPLEALYELYKQRDISQLAMMDDAIYSKGMERMESALQAGKTECRDCIAFLDIACRKARQAT